MFRQVFGRRLGAWLSIPFLLTGFLSFAQSTPKSNRMAAERLTLSLMKLHGEYQGAPPVSKAALSAQLRALAAQRQKLMDSLVQTSPGEALRVAIPASVAATMPASVQALLEKETDADGELQVAYEDSSYGATLHHFLNTGGQRLELKFAENTPSHLVTGAKVHVHGTLVGSGLALSSGTSTSSFQVTQAAPLANAFGAQATLVMLVNFQDNATQPFTVQDAQNAVFSAASNFWMENSVQQTWITGDVAGWYTLPISSATCDISSMQTYGQQAAQSAGYVLSNYNHFVYMFPTLSTCGWSGYSYIGGVPSSSWINGNISQQLVSHELGHALGLYHSHSMACGTVVYASSGCTQYEYGDYYDSMASSNVNGFGMDYNAFQRERLGWLNNASQPPITTVSTSGSYQIGPFEAQDSTVKALKILQSSTSGTYYYVEFRQPLGSDSALSNTSIPGYSQVANGVLVHMGSLSNANSSELLSMNPLSSWGTAMALDAGQSYTDSTAGVTIAVTSVNSSAATVQVTMAGATCTHVNPSLTMTPAQSAWVPTGSTVTFSATVTNNDGVGCASSGFNLAGGVPSGWSSSLGSSLLTLAPGASGTATLQVTSPSGTANGFYPVSVTGTSSSGSYSATASATYVVSTPQVISVSVSTDKATYSSSQTVTITVTVLSGGSPYAGTGVSVSIVPPKGGAILLSGTTGSNGTATLTYTLKKKASTGTYQVQASISAVGSTAATTSFTVQ